MFKRLVLYVAVSLGLSAAVDPRSVNIYRDTWGVPHIYAKTDAGAVYGLMYGQAEDNFWQLEMDYIRALGRAAEVEGRRGLSGDILYRAYEVESRAKAAYQSQNAKMRALCDAFADGVNRYLATHPQVKPQLLAHWEPWFILANEMRGAAGAGITASERARAFPLLAGTAQPVEGSGDAEGDEGSNMWAVAPSRSVTGHALLMINPHVGFFGGGQRYEAHLHSGEGLDVSGFAILGTPYIRSGHNAYLGWSHTNNYASTADVYLEALEGGTEWAEYLRIKTDTGAVETRRVTFRKTKHGPVLAIRGNQGLAVRAVAATGGVMEQRWAMAKARNLKEFQAAMARTALTGSNTMYADRAGNIWYLHGNAIPRRSTKFDWTKPVDGADPETDWKGLHKLTELPQVLNPPSGWLQNCNSTPFLTTEGAGNPQAADYPAYMAPEPDTPRSSRSRAILAGSRRFSFDDWALAAMDTKVGLAERRIPELLAAYRAKPVPEMEPQGSGVGALGPGSAARLGGRDAVHPQRRGLGRHPRRARENEVGARSGLGYVACAMGRSQPVAAGAHRRHSGAILGLEAKRAGPRGAQCHRDSVHVRHPAAGGPETRLRDGRQYLRRGGGVLEDAGDAIIAGERSVG